MSIILLISSMCLPKDNIEKHLINSFTKQLCSDIRYVRQKNMLSDSSSYIIYENNSGKSGYVLKENGKTKKSVFLPTNTKLNYSPNTIKFLPDGSPYPTGGTISVTNNKIKKEITIVPVSGRVLLKEGKYEK
ncbi:MAG: hypothetical protein RRZ84_00125 [Romboutsia sp.]